ncbi:hypothetical protein GDO78_003878 [Eleutherodactylus coqui]|uniref:Fatty acid desaturase domain-containing protein n=1 Tax=Eleutherodactylus coqui TaxID=57060 RepID=A0A8J6K165_ELECQ|nr:hypothetical protein GDO78_003878 [Eleutherodactylus coqui]
MVEDFRALRSTVEQMGLLKPNKLFFVGVLLHILLLDALAWLNLYFLGSSLIPFLITALLLGTVQAQAGWLQHDFGHLSVFSKSKWNHLVHKFVIGQLKGAPASWWNHLHFQHHAKPNCFRKDPDINMHPLFFALGKKLSVEDLAWMITFYVRFFMTYIPLIGVSGTISLFMLVRFLESNWFVWVTQMNHIPMHIDYDDNKEWLSGQLQATCNVDQSFFNDWFSGHLNFQIEHHLFPTMPRHNYSKVAPLVRSLCKKYGVEYQSKPLYTAFADIVHSLKESGELWLDAYLHK